MTTPGAGTSEAIDVASLGPAQVMGSQAPGVAPSPITGRFALLGYSLVTGAAAGALQIGDGTASASLMTAGEQLLATSSVTRWFGPQGIELTRGITVIITGANTTVQVYYVTLPQD
jgi:hypothetical protein